MWNGNSCFIKFNGTICKTKHNYYKLKYNNDDFTALVLRYFVQSSLSINIITLEMKYETFTTLFYIRNSFVNTIIASLKLWTTDSLAHGLHTIRRQDLMQYKLRNIKRIINLNKEKVESS